MHNLPVVQLGSLYTSILHIQQIFTQRNADSIFYSVSCIILIVLQFILKMLQTTRLSSTSSTRVTLLTPVDMPTLPLHQFSCAKHVLSVCVCVCVSRQGRRVACVVDDLVLFSSSVQPRCKLNWLLSLYAQHPTGAACYPSSARQSQPDQA